MIGSVARKYKQLNSMLNWYGISSYIIKKGTGLPVGLITNCFSWQANFAQSCMLVRLENSFKIPSLNNASTHCEV